MPDEEAVDAYLARLLVPEDPVLTGALEASAAAGLPPIAVSPLQGKLLMLLARLSGARRVLEIGTLGGYSTLWLALGLPDDGRLVTLEVDPRHAGIARASLDRSPRGHLVEVRVGPALETLPHLAHEVFDLVFVDADKVNGAHYLDWALRLTRPGALVVVDNVVRGGRVADPASDEPSAVGSRAVLAAMAEDPRIEATALQTVGAKGWDGFALGLRV